MSVSINQRASQPRKNGLHGPTERRELEQNCTQALLTLLPQVRQLVSADRVVNTTPLTVQQYSVLKALQERKLLISELADLLKVSRPTMSRIIDGLEGRRRNSEQENGRPKLVERVACQDDHRLVYAKITEEGQVMLRDYHIQAEGNITSVLQHLNSNDLFALQHSLEALLQAMQATKQA